MTKGDDMDEQQQEEFGDTTFVEGMVDAADDIATSMTTMRNRLIEQGFDYQTAETAALQHQGLINTLVHEKAKLERPRGFFG